MKRFTKVSLIICAVFVALGLLFVAIGAGLGFRTRQFRQMVREGAFTFDFDFWNWGKGGAEPENSMQDWTSVSNKWSANEVQNLDIEFSFGKLEFGYSDSDQVELSVDYREHWGSYRRRIIWNLDGDTLEVKDKVDKGIFSLFSGYGSEDATLYVLIPRGKEFDEISLDIGAAEVTLGAQLNAWETEFTLGAGSVQSTGDVSVVLSAKELTLDIGAGKMDLTGIQADFLDVDCGTGEMDLRNVTAEDMEVDCGIGSVFAEILGSTLDYDYKIDCGVGRVQVGDSTFSGLGQSRQIRNNTGRLVDIDCGVGEVTVSFKDVSTETENP